MKSVTRDKNQKIIQHAANGINRRDMLITGTSVVATLLGLASANAGTPVVTAVTVPDSIEGQSVAVSAVVDFGDRIVGGPIRNENFTNLPCLAREPNVPKGSPLGKTTGCEPTPPAKPSRPISTTVKSITRVVTAQLLAGDQSPSTGLVQEPPFNLIIPLNFTGSAYTAQFPFLPFDKYTVKITATQVERDCSVFGTRFFKLCSAPVTTQSTKTSAQFTVSPPQNGCFQFKRDAANNPSGLNGWTVSGVFDGRNEFPPPTTTNQMPATWLDQDGFLSANTDQDGALVQNLQASFFSPNSFPSGLWRIDFVSPDVSATPEWQNTTGLTFRMLHSLTQFVDVRPALIVTTAGSHQAVRRQLSGPTSEQFLSVFPTSYRVAKANFPLESGDVVNQVVISVFGSPQGMGDANFIALDGVCPNH
jgi:hypothetical protein